MNKEEKLGGHTYIVHIVNRDPKVFRNVKVSVFDGVLVIYEYIDDYRWNDVAIMIVSLENLYYCERKKCDVD